MDDRARSVLASLTFPVTCQVCGQEGMYHRSALTSETPPRTCGANRCLRALAIRDGRAHDCPACGRPGVVARTRNKMHVCVLCWTTLVTKCERKARYDTEDAATAYTVATFGRALHPYPCDYCSGWHYSKSSTPRQPNPEQAAVIPLILARIRAGLYTARPRQAPTHHTEGHPMRIVLTLEVTDPTDIDTNHRTGLSTSGYDRLTDALADAGFDIYAGPDPDPNE
jgi:hypothetical protein